MKTYLIKPVKSIFLSLLKKRMKPGTSQLQDNLKRGVRGGGRYLDKPKKTYRVITVTQTPPCLNLYGHPCLIWISSFVKLPFLLLVFNKAPTVWFNRARAPLGRLCVRTLYLILHSAFNGTGDLTDISFCTTLKLLSTSPILLRNLYHLYFHFSRICRSG